MKIVVMIPTYNEKTNIEKMIPILEKDVFPKIPDHDMHILVADDGSPDGTKDVVEEYMKKYKNLSLLEGKKNGLGAAYVRAMKYSMDKMSADAVIEFDSDFQHDPHDIPKLIAAMDEGYDYVIGSRYIPGGKIPKEWGLDRKILSKFGSLFTRIVWLKPSIHDMTSGFKLTKTSFLKKVDLDHLLSKDFAYKMHILHDLIKLGAKVKEVPIIFYEREAGASKINQKDQIDSLYVVIMLRIRDSDKFIKFLVVGGTGFVLNLVVYNFLATNTTVPLWVANTAGAELAIFSNYNFNNFWTFREHKAKNIVHYFTKMFSFLLTSNIGVFIFQNGLIQLGETFYGREYHLLYFLIGTSMLLVWNFTIYNKFIWKKK
jgi:dolichol-phosphate mannosyltransferase